MLMRCAWLHPLTHFAPPLSGKIFPAGGSLLAVVVREETPRVRAGLFDCDVTIGRKYRTERLQTHSQTTTLYWTRSSLVNLMFTWRGVTDTWTDPLGPKVTHSRYRCITLCYLWWGSESLLRVVAQNQTSDPGQVCVQMFRTLGRHLLSLRLCSE